MSNVKTMMQPLNERINALSVRERVIITFTLLVVLYFVWSALLMDRQIADIKSAKKEIDTQSSGINSLQIIQKTMTDQLASDPNREQQMRLERYLGEAERIDQQLREQTLEFISPQQMVEVLKDLIRQQSGLRLVSLESIEPEDPLTAALNQEDVTRNTATSKGKKDGEPIEPSGAYLHTLELKFKGDYLSAMRYIKQLESLEWRFIWKSLSIQLEKYPVTSVELQLQTLGLSDGWIGV